MAALGLSLAAIALLAPAAVLAQKAEPLYLQHCAACHGPTRLGGSGPALLPENLQRLKPKQAAETIRIGAPASQMPGFADRLGPADIDALVELIYTPLPDMPVWDREQIEASRVVHALPLTGDAALRHGSDPLNLFVVVETGDHHVSILDGDSFERLDRFPTPFAVHGGPKFTPDGRFVFIMSRDGWVQKYDLWSLQETGRVRAGIHSRNIAISKDGRWLAVANYLPRTLTILSTDDLTVARIFDVADKSGKPSRVSAVYQAPPRDSFILALKDVAEIWEIATDPNAPPVYEGYVHSHEKGMVEALPSSQGLFARRRIAVSQPLDDFFFDPSYKNLIGASRDGGRGVVVNLLVGREIAELPLPGMPHLGSGISWMRDKRRVMATPHLREARLSIVGMDDWSVVGTVETGGPGFFLRSHEDTPYVWADMFLSKSKDKLLLIDKQNLRIAKTLQPVPGATAAHVEFDRYGRYALVSIWEDDGALIVYDAKTLEEVRRIPMRRPSGKYNVWNKITFSEGTSH